MTQEMFPPITSGVRRTLKLRLLKWWMSLGMLSLGRPYVGLLGKDEDGVICSTEPVRPRLGCTEMPGMSGRNISKAIIKLAKRGYTPCGIYRVGGGITLDPSRAGGAPYKMGRVNGVIISVNTRIRMDIHKPGRWSERWLAFTDTSDYTYDVKVVPNKGVKP
jgi:hypothetical protein